MIALYGRRGSREFIVSGPYVDQPRYSAEDHARRDLRTFAKGGIRLILRVEGKRVY